MKAFWRSLTIAVLLGASAAQAQTIRIGAKSEPVMDPHYHWTDANVSYYRQIFSSLTTTNAQAQVLPDLAASWERVAPTEWVFSLRKDAKFSDGQPVTARDVAASFTRMRTIKAAATYAGAVAGLKDLTVIDDHTVKLTFNSPNVLAPAQVVPIQILPERLTSASGEEFSSGRAVVGSGPYKIASLKPGESLTIERNPYYYGKLGQWERVTFRFINDAGARVAALLGGDVDFIDAVPPSLVERIKSEPKFEIFSGPSARALFLAMDSARDKTPFVTDADGKPVTVNPLKNRKVRQALTHAVDRTAIVQRILGGLAFPTGQITPPGYGGYEPAITVPTYDPELSKKLLAEAGYPNGFGLTVHCPNDRFVEDAKICQALGQMFTRIGLKAKVETLPMSVLSPRAMDKNGERFSMNMMGWSDSVGEARVLGQVLHTPDGAAQGAWNWGGYSNPKLDALFDEAMTIPDAQARHAKLREGMRTAMEDAAVIPLHYQSVVVAARKGLTYRTNLMEFTLADSIERTP